MSGDGVAFDLDNGAVIVAGIRVEAALNGDRLRVAGCNVRALAFGERAYALELARAAVTPTTTLRRAIRDLAVDGVPTAIVDAIALHLAGASIHGAPSFADTIMFVARGTGWTPDQLERCRAADVDRIAMAIGGAKIDARSDWTRFELVRETSSTVDALVDELCEQLLSRNVHTSEDVPRNADAMPAPDSSAALPVERASRGYSATAPGASHAAPWNTTTAAADVASARSAGARASGGVMMLSEAPGHTPLHANDSFSLARPAISLTADGAQGTTVLAGAAAGALGGGTTGLRSSPPTSWRASSLSPSSPSFSPMPAQASAPTGDDIARLLEDECDLRGIAR